MEATFSISSIGDIAVLHCHGELDLAARLDFAGRLADLSVTDASRIVVDLGGTTFIDCGSVGVLEAFAHLLGPARRLVVACPPGLARRVLAITDYDELNSVVPTLADAVARAPRWG